VTVGEHPVFQRDGSDITVDARVPISQAVLGGTVEVPTLAGSVKVKVPPGTASGTRLRLKGKGVGHMGAAGQGDQYVRIVVDMPATLTDAQRELFAQLAHEGL